jgi:Potato inhibitor I family
MKLLIALFLLTEASILSTILAGKDTQNDNILIRQLQSKVISDTCALVRCSSAFPKCALDDQGKAQCVEGVCQTTLCKPGDICFGRIVQCITTPCPPIAECITDPCAIKNVCPMDTRCVVSTTGKALCVSTPGVDLPTSAPVSCAAVTCPIEAPICIIRANGSADCIQNPCLNSDFICNAASTCEVDEKGNPFCKPLPGNPGNPITCANVKCSSEAPYCVETPSGTVECVADPCKSGNFVCNAASTCVVSPDGKPFCQALPGNGVSPPWWDKVNTYVKETTIRRCNQRGDVPPKEGERCAKKSKTCFFSSQMCTGIGVFPKIRCDCVNQKWTCNNNLTCPKVSSGGSTGPWPECLGMNGDACCKLIEGLASDVRGNCFVILEGSPVTMDFSKNRVRVFVNTESNVTQIPMRG